MKGGEVKENVKRAARRNVEEGENGMFMQSSMSEHVERNVKFGKGRTGAKWK